MTLSRQLPAKSYLRLAEGAPAVLVTVGADGYGNAVMTWLQPLVPERVRFCVDLDTHTYANVRREGRAALHVSAAENVLLIIKGPVREVRGRVTAAPFGMAMWEMAVAEVKDQAWDGVTVAAYAYHWTGPQADDLRRIEQAVLAEMRDYKEGTS